MHNYIIIWKAKYLEGNAGSVDPSVFVLLLARADTKLAYNMPVRALAAEHVLVDDEALETDRPACVDAAGADTNLGAKAVAEAVGEARRRVHERARGVDATAERRCRGRVLGHDAVRVVRRVRVDVRHRCRERRHGEH